MKRMIHRGLALLFAMLMLFSIMLPTGAMAEAGAEETPDQSKTTEQAAETGPSEKKEQSDNLDQLSSDATPEQNKTIPEKTNEIVENTSTTSMQNSSPVDTTAEQQKQESSGSETVPGAGADADTNAQKPTTDLSGDSSTSGSQQKQEGGVSGIQSAAAKAAAPAGAASGSGTLTAADGSKKTTRTATGRELFVDAVNGSDEAGNGTFEAPFASLQTALEAAAGLGVDAELCLLSNVTLTGTIRILGQNVTITSNEGSFKIFRSEDFQAGEEGLENLMFEIGSSDPDLEQNPGGSLLLDHVIVDEQGLKADPEQDAIVAVFEGGKLILAEEAYLLNYGGNSAVHIHDGAELTVSSTAWILDMNDIPADGTEAVLKDEGSSVVEEEGSIILSHGQTYDEVYGKTNEESEEIGQSGETGNLLSSGNPTSGNDTGKEADDNDVDKVDKSFDDKNTNGINGVVQEDGKDKADETKNNTFGDDSNPDQKETDGSITLGANRVLKLQQGAPTDAIILSAASSDTESSPFKLAAPDSISSSDVSSVITIPSVPTSATGYEIPYQVSINPGEILGSFLPKTVLEFAAQGLESLSITTTVTLGADSLGRTPLPETAATGNPNVVMHMSPDPSFLKVESAVYDSDSYIITVNLSLGTGSVDNLYSPVTLNFRTVFLSDGYDAHIGETVTSTAKVDNVSGVTTINSYSFDHSFTDVESSATTKILGVKNATLTYDVNGGIGGPTPVKVEVAPDDSYPLELSNVPSHDEAGIEGKTYPVVFCGWTLKKDTKIYTTEDRGNGPETKETLDITEGEKITVYAAYSYDKNKDGTPDVNQRLLTLSFDANGGSGAPDPIIVDAGKLEGISIEIPSKEPTRKYYTFLGWSKDENATEAEYKYNADRKAKRDITIAHDTCLYAVWQENPVYTLYFNGNGGTNVPASVSARSDNGVAEMTIPTQKPTRTGRTFVGWAAERYGSAAFDPGEKVKLTGGNVTLYAIWQRNSSSGSAPRTGDESNTALYVTLAVGSAAAVGLIVWFLKRRKR